MNSDIVYSKHLSPDWVNQNRQYYSFSDSGWQLVHWKCPMDFVTNSFQHFNF